SERLENYCVINLKEGYFVDQLWMNLVPIYFEKYTKVLFHKGLNVAYWNLHERNIHLNDQSKYFIETYPLVFFHFSGYNPIKPSIVAKNQNRINFINRPDILQLFEEYRNDLIHNGYESYSTIKPYYTNLRNEFISKELRKKKSTLKGFSRIVISEIARSLRFYIKKLGE
ncbi:MAG: hypothetical protein ACKVOU_13255, partial [Cytophagales bacterium]